MKKSTKLLQKNFKFLALVVLLVVLSIGFLLTRNSELIQTNDLETSNTTETGTDAKQQQAFASALDNGSSESCKQLADEYLRDTCLLNIANQKKDQTLCQEVSDPTLEHLCHGRIDDAKESPVK